MQNFITTTKNLFFASLVSFAAFSANATTGVETVSDNYLYESLIQAEFEIDTQTTQAIVTAATNLDSVVLTEMASTATLSVQDIAE